MTIESTKNYIQHNADGVQVTFPYDFLIDTTEDTKVFIDGVEQVSGWTITGLGTPNGGDVIFGTAPASGAIVTIMRRIDYTQGMDYTEYSKFPAQSHEKALDRIVMQTQQLAEEAERSTKISIGVPDVSVELPGYEAGKALVWSTDPNDKRLLNSSHVFDTIVAEAAAARDDAIAARDAAQVHEQSAAAYEQKADDWANYPEDQEVETGMFSAFHWAQKAKTWGGGDFVSAVETARQTMAGPLSSIDPAAYVTDPAKNPRFWLLDSNGNVRGQLSWDHSDNQVELRLYDGNEVLQAIMELGETELAVNKKLRNVGPHYSEAPHATANIYHGFTSETGVNLGWLLLARNEQDLRLRLFDFTAAENCVDLVLDQSGAVSAPSCGIHDIVNPRNLTTREYVDAVVTPQREWVDVTGSRSPDVSYTNDTGVEIVVAVSIIGGTKSSSPSPPWLQVDGYDIVTAYPYIYSSSTGTYYGRRETLQVTVPPGSTYKLWRPGTDQTITYWRELRKV